MSMTNKVQLAGYCARKPELKYGKSGVAYAHTSIYTFDYKNKTSERHRCALLGDVAEKANQQLMKGTYVIVQGELRYLRFENNGQVIRVAEVFVEDLLVPPKEKPTQMLKRTLRLILDENNMTEDEIGILRE